MPTEHVPSTIDAVGAAETMAGGDATRAPVAAGSAPRVRAHQPDHESFVPVDPTHYVVGAELAKGGMGRIRVARDRRLGRIVALKELLVDSVELRVRFEREARITARLQHPAIVNILEAGRWPNGEPFYAMKLVEGESLAKVLAANRTFRERIALLPNVVAVVDALAYAHDKGVIHRDLKPSNVLVGEFGETVVIDWGLAKELSERGEAPPSGATPAPDGAMETAIGSVMGTPAYMPLEQANGEPVDGRADVYALGAILYHLLAGEAPYVATTTQQTIDAVRAAPPPPLASRAPEAPPDLIAIVEKAMARSADGRYPSAQQLGADLKRFQTGQLVGAHRYSSGQLVRRWLRRHRTAVAIAGIAVVLLAAFAIVSATRIVAAQHVAETERAAAEQHRGQAEELMAFMLDDVGGKLQASGKLSLLDSVAQKAVAYFDRSPPTTMRQLRERAIALSILGDVLVQQNDLRGALAQHLAAAAIVRPLVVIDPGEASNRETLARELLRAGDVLRAQGDLDAALALYRDALSWARAERDTAVAHEHLGQLFAQRGDARPALDHLRLARTLTEQLIAREPTVLRWQQDLWTVRAAIGDVLQQQGDLAGAMAEYRFAAKLADDLTERDPSNVELLRARSVSSDRLAEALRLGGDLGGALERYRTGLIVAEALAARDPANAYLQRDVAVSHGTIGRVLQDKGDLVGALGELRAALEITSKLAVLDPENALWQQDLGFHHLSIGEVLRAHGQPEEALVELHAGVDALQRLVAHAPTSAAALRLVYNGLDDLGGLLAERHRWPAALSSYRDCVRVARQLIALDPKSPRARADLGDVYEDFGDAQLASGDTPGAIESYRESITLRAALADDAPADADRETDLRTVKQKLARLPEGGTPPDRALRDRSASAEPRR